MIFIAMSGNLVRGNTIRDSIGEEGIALKGDIRLILLACRSQARLLYQHITVEDFEPSNRAIFVNITSRDSHVQSNLLRELTVLKRFLAKTMVLILLPILCSSAHAGEAGHIVGYTLQPSAIDPEVKNFNDPSYVFIDVSAPKDRPLVLFLTGTRGQPRGIAEFLKWIAQQGYRVIGLEYNDSPAVAEVCPQDPDPTCAEAFRQMRVLGDGPSRSVTNPPSEAIVRRLNVALKALALGRPKDGWDQYLVGGAPAWDRIVVSGMSQGAGMAAYIAKVHPVARVVLFSSPWDSTGRSQQPAPWLSAPSATPPERWYAEYHHRENTAQLLQRAYEALRIPTDHVYVFDLDVPKGSRSNSVANPFHVDTISNPGYAAQWKVMFGEPSSLGAAP